MELVVLCSSKKRCQYGERVLLTAKGCKHFVAVWRTPGERSRDRAHDGATVAFVYKFLVLDDDVQSVPRERSLYAAPPPATAYLYQGTLSATIRWTRSPTR